MFWGGVCVGEAPMFIMHLCMCIWCMWGCGTCARAYGVHVCGVGVVWVWCGVGVVWVWCGCGVGVVWVWCGCGVGVVWVWCGCGVYLTHTLHTGMGRRRSQQ